MKSIIANQPKSDNDFLCDLKSDSMLGTYYNDPEKRKISLKIERQFRKGFLGAATDAA